MKEHVVKSWPEYFEPVASGKKSFEVRRNDRDYQVGDVLILQEWEPPPPGIGSELARDRLGSYTGRECRRGIVYILHGAGVGCVEPLKGLGLGYVVLGLVEAWP